MLDLAKEDAVLGDGLPKPLVLVSSSTYLHISCCGRASSVPGVWLMNHISIWLVASLETTHTTSVYPCLSL